MPEWPATRVTLLDRLSDPRDHEAWAEFVSLYGPLVFQFARRRLPQDEDAADVMQEVLSAVMQGRYQRPKGRFQKWIVTVLLNKIRDFHAALRGGARFPPAPRLPPACCRNHLVAKRKNGTRSGSGTYFAPPPSASGFVPIPFTGRPLCEPPCKISPVKRSPVPSMCP